jgi:predicted  nucleic acid-binding Zn-ribbon protein
MRTTLSIALVSIALAAGGCKKKQDDTGAAGNEVKKTAENVNDQAKDYNKTAEDKDSKPKDLDKAQADLQAAKVDLVAAKDKFTTTVKDRMAKLDIKINELAARTDAKSKQAAVDLKARRDALSTKLGTTQNLAAADWDAFTKDVNDSFDKIEKDTDDALK